MINKRCLGCHTYFQEGEKVPLEGISIEFKEYYLPIKDSKHKWILLKTMVGFLNSKGGVIYVGIEDNQGRVIGQKLARKEKDDFLLFIKSIGDRIIPAVDFYNKEEISIVYVPVVASKQFKGKYIIKIVVKQGDPSKTYHFSQIIELNYKGKVETYQIPHAFYRHNMGGIIEVKGEALLEEIARKAAAPNQIATTFHMFCNPKPLDLEGALTKIGFSGIRKEELGQKLETIFHNNLQSFDVDYELTYDIENQLLLIGLDNEEQFKQVNKYLSSNLDQLNKGREFNFIEKGEYLDLYLYKNIGRKRGLSADPENKERTEEKDEKGEKGEKGEKEEKEEKDISSEEPQQMIIKEKEEKSPKECNIFEQLKNEDEDQLSPPLCLPSQESNEDYNINKDMQQVNNQQLLTIFEESQILTITHICPHLTAQLALELHSLLPTFEPTVTKYSTTLQLKFPSFEDLLEYHQAIMQKYAKLSSFGLFDKLVIGANTKKIVVRKYNIKSRKQLKVYIKDLIKSDSQEIEFKKLNNKFFLEITLRSQQLACQWLDTLLTDKQLEQFNRPGSEGSSKQMRMYLYCKVN